MIIDFHTHIWTEEMVSPGYKKYLNNFSEMAHVDNNQYKADPNNLIVDLDEAEIDKAVIFISDYSFTEAKMAISIEDYINFVIKSCDEYNDKFIEIRSGLREGERVMMKNPAAFYSFQSGKGKKTPKDSKPATRQQTSGTNDKAKTKS